MRHPPNQQTTLNCNLQTKNKPYADVCGVVEPKVNWKKKLDCAAPLPYRELTLKQICNYLPETSKAMRSQFPEIRTSPTSIFFHHTNRKR